MTQEKPAGKNVILTGANGMVGRLILEQCLNSSAVKAVTAILRKPLEINHPKLVEVMHHDFLNFDSVKAHFVNKDVAFYCIGVYTGQVPVDEFKRITVDFTRTFCETLYNHSPQAAFCFLSGQGADQTEQSSILFAKQKGIAENIILNQGFGRTHLFRPGYIYPDTPRKEPNQAYKLMRFLYKPVAVVYPNIGVSSTKLATKMFTVGIFGGEKTIYENSDIRN